MNRSAIEGILPHRDHMLLVDEVEFTDGVSSGRYTVRGDEFFLCGHFPGNPVVPGVILCEMMAQSACLLVESGGDEFTPYLTGLNNVKFRGKVTPGDTVEFKCELNRRKGAFYFIKCAGYVGGALCVSGEISFAVVKRENTDVF